MKSYKVSRGEVLAFLKIATGAPRSQQTRRSCGDCSACCSIMPIGELNKGSHQRCQFLTDNKLGCSIYAKRPRSCREWACIWAYLPHDTPHGLKRPDLGGYLIDMLPDTIVLQLDSGELIRSVVCQIWLAANKRDAHKSPELREYLNYLGEGGVPALIRYGHNSGFVLFPPSITESGWIEQPGTYTPR